MPKKDQKALANTMYNFPPTAEAAKNTIIYFIDGFTIQSSSLYDFVMQSIDYTTSPRGNAPVMGYEYNHTSNKWVLYEWLGHGSYYHTVSTFDNENDAADEFFKKAYNTFFSDDDQRDTMYYNNYDSAKSDLIENIAAANNIDLNVAASVLHHIELIEKIKLEREKKRITALKDEKNRVHRIADEYAKMIDSIPGESHQQTTKRLAIAIGERIEKSVFYKAIDIIRNRS